MSYNNNDYNAGWKGGSSNGRNQAQYRQGYDDRTKFNNTRFGPPASPTCFPASAQVRTPGGWRPIGALSVGDEVLGFDEKRNYVSARAITKRFVHGAATLWEIRTVDRAILTTAGHLFLTESGWRRADALTMKDELVTIEDSGRRSVAKVISLSRTAQREPVYNLYTSTDHTYIVEGCVVHNFSHLRLLRTWLHRLLIDPWKDSVPGRVSVTAP
jgi:hypothetical protein